MANAHDRELEAFMQRFYKLRDADKVRAHKSIRDHLGDRVGEEGRRDEIIRLRTEALEALSAVRDYLGLPKDQAPTKAAFDREAKTVAPEWTAGLPAPRDGRHGPRTGARRTACGVAAASLRIAGLGGKPLRAVCDCYARPVGIGSAAVGQPQSWAVGPFARSAGMAKGATAPSFR